MRYTQDSGVRRVGDSDEYKVVVSIYLTPSERDLWGARKVRLALEGTGYERGGSAMSSETEYEYGCVRCQAYHRESDRPVYTEHLPWQSKHGTRRSLRGTA